MRLIQFKLIAPAALMLMLAGAGLRSQGPGERNPLPLPSGKVIYDPVPGRPVPTNSFPGTVTLSPDGHYLAILNDGWGTPPSGYSQSIGILDLDTHQLRDFPDSRLRLNAHQVYFCGLAFSSDGILLYASMASYTDPAGQRRGDTGNGIAVYNFHAGNLTPAKFLSIPLQNVAPGKKVNAALPVLPAGKSIPYPAGLAVVRNAAGRDELLVADNLSDNALLLDSVNGRVLKTFDLSTGEHIPASYPYAVVAAGDGTRAYCSLWNASEVAELDLSKGLVTRHIRLLAPSSALAAGSHPTALLLSPDEKLLYVALSNADAVAVVDTTTGRVVTMLSTLLPDQKFGGSFPSALAESADGQTLFVADSGLDAVALFDIDPRNPTATSHARGFVPTEWYPAALAVRGDDLIVTSGKGRGSGPNGGPPLSPMMAHYEKHPYVMELLHGSVARLRISEAKRNLESLTQEAEQSNLMQNVDFTIHFRAAGNPIRHVIYVIKENRSYDQIFGDLKPGNADPSLCLYGEDITPNAHKLARQFGILDNFYCSGNVSGDGHVWSTAATSSDYTERTWQVMQRADERTYDYEGDVGHEYPLLEGIPDVDEPATGYLWANVDRHGLTHRNYSEFIETQWCDTGFVVKDAKENHPLPPGASCPQNFVRIGEPLPANVGEPHGSPSPWPWPVPMMFRDIPTKPEIEGHYDLRFPDFRLDYPDQLRVDEFLNEFEEFVKAQESGKGDELPQFVLMRLPNDHTAGTKPGFPTPAAMVAENDLAVGRLVEAVSHSPYWQDTAIMILEDDAQDGPDHVDAHRSPTLVISKYSPGNAGQPFVDNTFYTTVSTIHTIEVLLGLPPMNVNDAHAPIMSRLFEGAGAQIPFEADYGNQRNGLIYKMNTSHSPGAAESAKMDFSHADAADAKVLNAILWRDRKGLVPMPDGSMGR
jgi:DNA-binding beta-propeller fold protein YncE